ncbi:hypothetical protein F5887DRAFT_649632 [Amanita rubescens]|nr:hypothetical protein F5887DRAFT_649632 [Amanita rubescens]
MNLFTLFFLSLFSFVLSFPLFRRDVFVPPILYPIKTTVWRVGEKHHVIWDNTHPPAQITNPFGKIYLRKGGERGLTDVRNPLIGGFNVSAMDRIEITVPATYRDEPLKTGSDYQIVLMGNSGNWSPEFTIIAPGDATQQAFSVKSRL